ncbi:MAG TPA: 50S ribosomal protein L13 [Verrucomicrobia bacterium]|nr:MAG: 50S ribosomal protein L13 [Lentisphaerae bacterium GWF2_57_35]HBA84033.1 50S ribosomal protein L13 [Verrucomicrobiota bacterium]
MKTTLPVESEIKRAWHLIDATDKPAGRLAVQIAELLRGKGKIDYAPHIDMGDFVVVINASKVKLTGNKEEGKLYQTYSGFAGGLKKVKAGAVRSRNPAYIITHAVKDMLPKNHMSRIVFERLKVYAGTDHPHTAQKPQVVAV